MSTIKTALVVGSSRGLGFAIAEELLKRNWNVIGTVRKGKRTKLHELAEKWNGKLQIQYLDITIPTQVERLKSNLNGESLDLLFVNAGVANEKGMQETIGEISTEEFVRVMVTNTLSPMRVLEKLTENVRQGGVVGVMSSGQGSIADNENGGNDVYRASKAALNMLMRSFSVRREKIEHFYSWPLDGLRKIWVDQKRSFPFKKSSAILLIPLLLKKEKVAFDT